MDTFYTEFIERLTDLHKGILTELEDLPAVALDWIPGSEMNSISVLIVHLTGAERYWIGDVALGDLSGRDRASEFRASNWTHAAPFRRLEESLEFTKKALGNLKPADLDRQCTSPRDGRSYRLAWALFHALEHTAIHLGHIQITRQLWAEIQ